MRPTVLLLACVAATWSCGGSDAAVGRDSADAAPGALAAAGTGAPSSGSPHAGATTESSAPPGDASVGTPPPEPVPGAVDGGAAAALALPDSACPLHGLWRLCSVADRLERSGFVLRPVQETVSQPGLQIRGSAFLMGRAEIQLYLYPDSVQAGVGAQSFDARKGRPAQAEGILRPPTVIRSNNLLALLFNNNDRQLERVQLALAGGLPFP